MHEGLLACHVQSAIQQEKTRLSSVRVKEDSALAAEVASISGQQLPAAATLEELLRRPHVHYRSAAMHLLPGVLSPSYSHEAKRLAHSIFQDFLGECCSCCCPFTCTEMGLHCGVVRCLEMVLHAITNSCYKIHCVLQAPCTTWVWERG